MNQRVAPSRLSHDVGEALALRRQAITGCGPGSTPIWTRLIEAHVLVEAPFRCGRSIHHFDGHQDDVELTESLRVSPSPRRSNRPTAIGAIDNARRTWSFPLFRREVTAVSSRRPLPCRGNGLKRSFRYFSTFCIEIVLQSAALSS